MMQHKPSDQNNPACLAQCGYCMNTVALESENQASMTRAACVSLSANAGTQNKIEFMTYEEINT